MIIILYNNDVRINDNDNGKDNNNNYDGNIARTHGCVRSDSVTGLQHQSSTFHCHFKHPRAVSLLSHTYSVQTELRWLLANEFNKKSYS